MSLPQSSKPFYDPNGLAFRERKGDAGTIVLLHGLGFSKEVFDAQFESEALKDYRLVAVDLPGHGESADATNAAATYCYSGFARAAEDLLEMLSVESCVVVGWSLGGHVALELAAQSSKVSGVLTMGTAPAPGGPLGLVRSKNFSRGLLLSGMSQFTAKDAQQFESLCFGDAASGEFVPTLMRTDPLMRPSLAKSTLMNLESDQHHQVMNSPVDICLLHGAKDPFIRTDYMATLVSPTIHGGGTIILKDSGHAPFMDQPRGFETVLIDFFENPQDRRITTPDCAKAA